MDLSQRSLQINGKLFSNFKLIFILMAENPKIFKQIGGVNIDQSAMCYYISMDLS